MKYKKPKVVAEIGCNHAGDLELAKQLIEVAAMSGASYAKFQKRNNKYLLKEDYNKPHPNPVHSFGSSYGKHREFLEFTIPQHYKLFEHCKKKKIKYAISVWEVKSAEAMVKSKIELDYLKIPSACNLDFELLEYLLKKFNSSKIFIITNTIYAIPFFLSLAFKNEIYSILLSTFLYFFLINYLSNLKDMKSKSFK